MTNTLNAYTLLVFQTFSPGFKKQFLQKCSKKFIHFLCECLFNLVEGNLAGIEKQNVTAYKHQIRRLTQKTPGVQERRQILSSPKGLALLKAISPSVISKFIPEADGRF